MRVDDGAESETVDVIDLSSVERLSWIDDLVARRQDRDARLCVNRHLGLANGRQGADAARRQQFACPDDRIAGRDVRAASADVPAGWRGHPDVNLLSLARGFFHHDHGVGARRQGRAGGDLCAGAGHHRHGRHLSRIDAIDQPQPRGRSCRRAHGIRRHDGVAVHSGAVETRDLDVRCDVGCAHEV